MEICRAQQHELQPKFHSNLHKDKDKNLDGQQKRIKWTFLEVREGPSSAAELQKKKATKIAVNQEE